MLTNGLSNALDGQNFFAGAGKAALWGGAFAAVRSGMESLKNAKEKYGFGTDKGRLNKMIDNYKYSANANIETLNANTASEFVQHRYGLSGADFIYDPKGTVTRANGYINYGVTPGDLSNNIFLDRVAFKNSNILKATMVHEYGHLKLDKIINNGVVSWRYNNYSNSLNNPTLYQDGPLGYSQEIFNSGKMHISPSTIRPVNMNPLYSIWNGPKYGSKLFYMLPRRFNIKVKLRFY